MKRKGRRREAGSEGSVDQRCEPMPDMRRMRRSRMRSVDPAVVHRRRLSLPREICPVSPQRRLRRSRGRLTAGQKSAEGVLGQAVGKAIEALQDRKVEKQIGGAGNDG